MGFKGGSGNTTIIGGSGDMERVVYDQNNNMIVDKAETLDDGVNSSTAAEVRNLLDNPPQGDKNYVHVQNIASGTWVVVHNLAKKVSVTIVDTANTIITGQVTFVDDNNLLITLSPAMSGQAFIN